MFVRMCLACFAVIAILSAGVAQYTESYCHHTDVACFKSIIENGSQYDTCESACSRNYDCKAFVSLNPHQCWLTSYACEFDELEYMFGASYYNKIEEILHCDRFPVGKPRNRYCHRAHAICPGYDIRVVDVEHGLEQCQLLCDYNVDCRSIQFHGGRNCTLGRYACNYTELIPSEYANDYVKISILSNCEPECPMYYRRQNPSCNRPLLTTWDAVETLEACRTLCNNDISCNSYQYNQSHCVRNEGVCLLSQSHVHDFYAKFSLGKICRLDRSHFRKYCIRRENYVCPGHHQIKYVTEVEDCEALCNYDDNCLGIEHGGGYKTYCYLLFKMCSADEMKSDRSGWSTYVKVPLGSYCRQYKIYSKVEYCKRAADKTCEKENDDVIFRDFQVSLTYCQDFCEDRDYCKAIVYDDDERGCTWLYSVCSASELVDSAGSQYLEKIPYGCSCPELA